MKHKCWLAVVLAIGLVGCATTGGSSDEKTTLSSSAKPETKAAITAAETANNAAKAAGFEWYWGNKATSKHLQDAIKAANNGDDAAAVKLAKQIELAGIQGQAQAEAAKTAGPKFAKSATKPAAKTATVGTKAGAPAAKASGNGSKVYGSACATCHDAGIAGSPKFGDKAAWAPRIAAGKMYEVALKGKGGMPAKGGNASLSDADVKAAVDYMVASSK